jgi:CAAX protease family protein
MFEALSSSQPTMMASRRLRLWAELAVLFGVLPVVMAVAAAHEFLGEALVGMAVLAVLLLAITPGFRWRSLLEGRMGGKLKVIVGFAVATAVIATALVLWLQPDRFLNLPLTRPQLWLVILVVYPLVSAVPQEIIYRVLFFERYGALFPDPRVGIALNAACFGLAHLFYANWLAVVLTTGGGAVFAWAYVSQRSFVLACVLHAIGGLIIFTSGLGVYFYHGAIGTV